MTSHIENRDCPLVSVILPTHNRATVLARAMRSVLAQSFADIELIVVDDASTDHTADVIGEFDDKRIVYQRLTKNLGAAVARNRGAQIARGKYLAFQDSDDEWLLDKLTKQLVALRKYDTDLLCCGYVAVRKNGKSVARLPDSRMQAGDWGADNIYDFCFITPTWLITRQAFESLGGFDESMPNLEDWELSFRLFKTSHSIRALDEILMVKYSGEQDSLNWKMAPRIQSLAQIIRQHEDIWGKHRSSYARLYEDLGRIELRAGQMPNGRRSLWQAIRLQPTQAKRWLHWLASFAGHKIYASLLKQA